MTFLPIVERELRETARRRGTFGGRMAVAGLGTVALAVCFIASAVDPSVSFVKSLFWGLSGLCMFYCLLAGRFMTADCLSREKREGTLGLLFLTDLKGYDVVLGKLAATSLNGFYGLMAVFPLLAVPLLAGGIASGEFWRMTLVLLNTFLFSASVGLFVSSVCRHERKTMGANLGLLLLLAGLPPALFGWWLPCPLWAFWLCSDARYKFYLTFTPADPRYRLFLSIHRSYWESFGITFGLTVVLLALACWLAPRSWQDTPKPARARQPKLERRRRTGNPEKAAAFRKRALDRNAYFWLAARPYFKVWQVWMVLLLLVLFWASTTWSVHGILEVSDVVFALLLSAALKLYMTTEATRPLAEDKKSGAFELLLSTPLTAREITRGQGMALRRQFLKPAVAAVVAALFCLGSVWALQARKEDAHRVCWIWLAEVAMFVADMIALGWAGMWAGATAKSHGRATIKTAAGILVLPWALFGLAELGAHLFMLLFVRQSWDPDWPFDLACWMGVGLFVDVLLTVKAWRGLRTKFYQLVWEPPERKRRLAWLWDWRTGSPERKAVLRRKFRRAVVAAAMLLTVGTILVLWDSYLARIDLPKPLIISMRQSNNPVQVAGTRENVQNGFLFILPDGALWSWRPQAAIAPPHQIGADRDWRQVSVGRMAAGVRSNGTLWTWTFDTDEPQQFERGHDWLEVDADFNSLIGRKSDGSLWTESGRASPTRDWRAVITGNVSGCNKDETFAIHTNGTLWAWGTLGYVSKGMWRTTNYDSPIQTCRESNWVGFNGKTEEGVRSQTGEAWGLDPLIGLPSADVSISAVGHLESSNAAMIAHGPFFGSNWIYAKYELRTDGTLWAFSWDDPRWAYWGMLMSKRPLGPPVRVGQRSDWVGIWSTYETMIGLTADGTLWTWGSDYGQESHWVSVFTERAAIIKNNIEEMFGGFQMRMFSYKLSDDYPAQKEPRPLMRLMMTNGLGEVKG